MRKWKRGVPLASAALLAVAACARTPDPARAPRASIAELYVALPDTVLCVVDRSVERGLRHIAAKRAEDGSVVVLVEGQIAPLARVHPVTLVAGYAGAERWLRDGEPLRHEQRRFVRLGGERRVPLDLVTRVGDHRGVPLFAAPDDRPPQALYVPVRPGCIFQAYVREDLAG